MSSSTTRKNIFARLDQAILMAMEEHEQRPVILGQRLDLGKPTSFEHEISQKLLLTPKAVELLAHTTIFRFKEDTRDLLIKDSLRRLVRKRRIEGYWGKALVMKNPGDAPVEVRIRRYRTVTVLDAIAKSS